MGSSLGTYENETEAKSSLKEIIETTTNDYKIYIKARKQVNSIYKEVVMSIVVLPQYSEDIFNNILKLKLQKCPDKIVDITTSLFLDENQRVLKDNILVTLRVEI